MSGMVRKGGFSYPGLIESAFCIGDLTVEVIADGCHLPVEILEMVYRLKGPEKVALTCDSMRCAGQNVKESVLGSLKNGQRVIIEDDVAKMPDRTAFAGSIATDDRLVRVMYHQARVPLWDCVRMMRDVYKRQGRHGGANHRRCGGRREYGGRRERGPDRGAKGGRGHGHHLRHPGRHRYGAVKGSCGGI